MKSVCIILLNWNGWQDTVECLRSLKQLDYACWRAIVVDNGSTDDSLAQIRQAVPDAMIIETGSNLGFAAGCNIGITHALRDKPDFVWLLNNDTVAASDALKALVIKAETDPNIGAVGSAIYRFDNPKQLQAWGGGYINFWLGRSRHFVSPVRDEQIHFITGASLLVRSSVLETLGTLDEGFFMYWEDADYCFRLRRAGWGLAVAEDSVVWHKESASVGKESPRLDTLFNRSATRFFRNYAPVPMVPICIGVGLRFAKRAIRGDWKRARAVWTGARHREIVTLP